jgi:hypothetical protein
MLPFQSCAAIVRSSAPLAASQIRTLPVPSPVAIRRPSWLNRTLVTDAP